MLKVRIIPTLLYKNYGLVKGVKFDSWRRIGPVLPTIKVHTSREVDELIFVDIMASKEGSDPDNDSVADFSEECAVPLTVGGGISRIDHIASLLYVGADKISINTAAYTSPALIDAAARRFGAQCVVASVDARRLEDGTYRCFSHSAKVDAGREPAEWARELVDRGAGEILLTSIDRDGTMTGYDLELVARVALSVGVPVIASGGAGNYQDMIDVIKQAGASAVACASIFHFTDQTPAGAKAAMQNAGIPVRRNFVGIAQR